MKIEDTFNLPYNQFIQERYILAKPHLDALAGKNDAATINYFEALWSKQYIENRTNLLCPKCREVFDNKLKW